MNEKSQNNLENKLNESIDSLHHDLDNLISQLNNKISLNSSNSIPTIQSKEELEENRSKFLKDFINYDPTFNPNFMKNKKINSKLPKFETLPLFISNLCKKEVERLKEKERIISRRMYSSKLIQAYLEFFTYFIKSNMKSIEKWNNTCLRISNSSSLSFEDLLSFMSLIISENRFEFPLNFLYKSFKYYNVTNRDKILTKVFERFRSDLLYVSKLSIPKSPEDLENEMKRISLFCDIPFELDSHDGQKFFYHCEKAFTDAFLIKIPADFFDITKVNNMSENNVFTMINNSIANTIHIDKSLIESLKFLFTGDYEEMTKFFNQELFKFKLQKEVSHDHVLYFMKIRFVKNKKTLISLYNNCKAFISLKSRLTKVEFSDDDVNSLFKQNLHLILSFASKLTNKTFGELDTYSILETAFSLQLRFEQSKGKLINALLSIHDHTNDESINSLIIKLIDQKPYLFYDPLKSYEIQFELNVDLLDVIGQCMWLMINLQILNEQMSSSSSFIPSKNEDVYLFSNDSVPISRFEVFPRLLSILKFYKKAPLMTEEICESLSVNYIRFNLYFSHAIWSILLEDIKEFTKKCPLPFEKTQMPNLTDEVFHLFSNEIFDNFECIEKFLIELNQKENKSDTYTTIARNFIRLNKCISKLQNCYNLQKKLLPIYNEQLNAHITSPSFELPLLNPEFLVDPSFDEKVEVVYQSQVEFTKMLTIAVKFNNYQSDSLYMRSHFDLTKLGRDYSMMPYEENVKNNLNEFIVFSMFYSPEEFNSDKPLCDLSKSPSYSKYNRLNEIAFMSQLENAFFHFNPVKEFFNYSQQFYISENNSLALSVIPTLSQIMTIPDDKIEDAYSLISNRIMICHLIRFESAIQSPILHVFNSISNGKLNWNGGLLSHLFSEIESHPFVNLYDAIEAFNHVLFFRINLVLLSTVFNLCNSKDYDQSVITSVKETWIEIHRNRIPITDDDYLTLKRYSPEWVDLFLPNLAEIPKALLINQFSIVDNGLSEKLILNPKLKSLDIVENEFNQAMSVLACSILQSKEKLENCTIEQAVKNVSQVDLIQHSVSSSSNSPRYSSSKNDRSYIEKVKNLILQKQIDDINELSDSINVKMANTSLSTSTKPDFYNEKKNLFNQQLYNPPPVEVWRQFNFETNYRFGKLVSKLIEFLRTPNLTKEKLIEFCKKVSPYISLSENPSYTIQYNDKKPINASIQTDFDRFCQIYSTYIKNSINEIETNKENVALLSQLERCFKDDQYSQWQVNCTSQNTEKIMELNNIRDKLDQLNVQQKEEDEVIRENIRTEYEALLDDIRNLIEKEKQKFGRYQNKLYGNVKKSIQSHILSDKSIDDALRAASKANSGNHNAENEARKENLKLNAESTKQNKNNELAELSKELEKQIESTTPKNNEFPKLKVDQNKNESSEFPKLKVDQNKNENSEFPKVKFILNKQNDENESNEFPKFQTNSGKTNEESANELQFILNAKKDENENENSEFPKFQFDSNPQNSNERNEFPKFQVDSDDQNEELKFDHRVLFSPNSNRNDSSLYNDDTQFDSNPECRRSRPPSATTGFLISGETRPHPPHSPITESDTRGPFRITSPPLQNRPNYSNPLKRRSIHNSIFAAYMDHSQVEKVEDEIDRLKKEILKIRVVHCMNLFAMEKYYTGKIETATQEYREINTILWNSRRNFEEDVRSITSKIEESYNELTDYEAEIEATRAKIEKRKQQTLQLRHWKNVNLQTCDSIQSQLKNFNSSNSLDIDVLTLIKKVEQSRAELEMLMLETQDFEDQLDQQIREPMAAIDYYKRRIQRTKCETAEIRYQAQLRLQQQQQQQQQQQCSITEEDFEEEPENEDEDENEDNSKPKYFKFKLNLSKKEEEDDDDDEVLEKNKNKNKSNQKYLKFKLKQKNENDEDEEDEEIGQELEELELEKYQENDSDDEQEYSDKSGSSTNKLNNKQMIKEDQIMNRDDAVEISEIQKYLILNQEIADLNEQLRHQIREIEERKAKMKPELRESIEQLTTEPQATPRPLISHSSDKKIYKPTPAPRRRHQKTLKVTLK